MSRVERERRQEAEERWPHLQILLSRETGALLYGDTKPLHQHLRATILSLPLPDRQALRNECRDFLDCLSDRHDDWAFMRDGFNVRGQKPQDNRGGGHTARDRVKMIYDVATTAVRNAASL